MSENLPLTLAEVIRSIDPRNGPSQPRSPTPSISSITALAKEIDQLAFMASDPNTTAADRKSSAGARAAALGAMMTLVSKEINRPPTVSSGELEKMRPIDAAKFFKAGGTITDDE